MSHSALCYIIPSVSSSSFLFQSGMPSSFASSALWRALCILANSLFTLCHLSARLWHKQKYQVGLFYYLKHLFLFVFWPGLCKHLRMRVLKKKKVVCTFVLYKRKPRMNKSIHIFLSITRESQKQGLLCGTVQYNFCLVLYCTHTRQIHAKGHHQEY